MVTQVIHYSRSATHIVVQFVHGTTLGSTRVVPCTNCVIICSFSSEFLPFDKGILENIFGPWKYEI